MTFAVNELCQKMRPYTIQLRQIETNRSVLEGREAMDSSVRIQERELVTALVGQITKDGDIIVASDRKSKLWGDLSFEAINTKLEHETYRHCEESSVSVESVHQQCTTGKSVEDQRDCRSWKIGDEDRDECSGNWKVG